MKVHFPTGEIFAPLASFLFSISPQHERKIQEFRHKYFGPFTIGLQIRRKKCYADRQEAACELRPSVQNFCAVARSIQVLHGLHDDDVRFFVAADEEETYSQVH
jgi:xyloglucan fucosyltransferase